jgi:hypothetical protein
MPGSKQMLWIAAIAIVAVFAYNQVLAPNVGLPSA